MTSDGRAGTPPAKSSYKPGAWVRAVVVDHPGGPERLTTRAIDAPISHRGVAVVAVEAVGVNRVDLSNRQDPVWAGLVAPYVVGYEFAGRVVAAGESADGVQPGDSVWGLLPVRGTRWGAMTDRVNAPLDMLAPLPPELNSVTAAALPLAGCTALQVLQRLQLARGSWLLVHGASGGVGHLLIQIARSRGIHVAAGARIDDRDRLTKLGVDLWLDRDADVAAVAAAELGRPVDAVVDLVGGQLATSQHYTREGGQLASIVDLKGDLEPAKDLNLTIHGVLVRPGRDNLSALATEVRRGLRPDVALTLPLASAADAHRRLAAGSVRSKIVLTTGGALG